MNTENPKPEWTTRYHGALMPVFGTPQLLLERGDGAVVWDHSGKEYLDLYAGIAVNALGHAHPALVEAVAQQVATLGHVCNFYASAPQIAVAEKLLTLTSPGREHEGSVFLTNSGTESIEAALKIVKAYANTCQPAKTRILAMSHSFHGRSTGALALTWKEAYRQPFAPLIAGIEFLPADDEEALREAMGPDVAAVFVEPIQGEAGARVLSDSYLQLVRQLTAENDALMVVDEVQTGCGRTGKWMGHHWAGIEPDIVTLAKGIAGGMPMGACLAWGKAATILGPGMHGSTFSGNPVCSAAAMAVLTTLETEGLIERAQQLGDQWRKDLAASAIPHLTQVRGRGLLIGIDFDLPIGPRLVDLARDAGFLINATGPHTIRLAPPLIISAGQLGTFTGALPNLVERAATIQRAEAAEGTQA